MEAYCDLHVHSLYSDGTLTPGEILLLAEEKGLTHVALTDHNTVSGLLEFLRAAEGLKVSPVPGIEISAGWQTHEIHMLGLFLMPERMEEVDRFVGQIHHRKDQSNRDLVNRLQDAGFAVDYDAMVARTRGGHINRAHIARALMEKGYVASIDEAVKGILSPAYGLYRPPERLDALECIAFLRSVGALPVMAHPFLNLTEEALLRFLPLAKNAGLAGMETHYSLFDEDTTQKAVALARRFSLLESGGSDFHGAIKPHISLGSGLGNLKIPGEFAVKMEEAAAIRGH